ncbi:hypothetical protein [Lacticaseibacillus suibinensis]|uniref:hypothetical protein n=1 Tax=Lacticaseibacillus suibinensis TaxID=2486011 RepID=UPI000F7B1FCF|nr:hypothetical protein [Lacticaseibacillus suibinensis]
MKLLSHFFSVPLYRELTLGALIVLFLVIYYLRYVHFAKMPDSRHARLRLDSLIKGTRWLLIALVLALVGLIIVDRTGVLTTKPAAVQTSQHSKATASTSSAKRTMTKTKAEATSVSSRAASSQSNDATIISDESESLSTAHDQALQVVEKYYQANPDAKEPNRVYRYRSEQTGNAGVKVTEIGGYLPVGHHQLKLTHVYWVYPSGMFDVVK